MSRLTPISLSAIRSHSIFRFPESSTSAEDDWELIDRFVEPIAQPKTSRMVMRDKELLIASGKELRMMTMSGGEGWEVSGDSVGRYKTLTSEHLNFAIQTIVLNPTGHLLAVVGHHQLGILVLPKSGSLGTSGKELPCRSFAIDEFQFSPSSTLAISKAIWHPWGESGNSLWILTTDGKLREYNVLSPEDPMQTFTFLTSVPSSSRFTAVDPLSQIATSFSFGAGKYDFSPLMVYVLVANGDIYSMGPVLPVHAEIPQRYLQALRAHTEGRSRRIQEEESKDDESTARVERIALQVQWLDSLAKQIKQAEEARRRRVDDEWATPSRQNNFQSQRHRRTNSNLPDDLRRTTNDGMVRIHPPHLTETGGPAPGMHRGCMRQGPMVFSPGPSDLGYAAEEQEQVASDLCIFSSEVGPMQRDKQAEIGDARDTVTVVAIAWSSGRVDLGVELEKVEPRWISSRDALTSSPMLPIIESILLHVSSQDLLDGIADAPSFVADPIHPDTFYVQHALGVDAVYVRPWISALGDEEVLPPSEVTRLIDSSVSKPMAGVVIFCNMHLGYGLLAFTSSHQVATIELEYRLDDSPTKILMSPDLHSKASDEGDDRRSQSLLLAERFDIDRLIASVRKAGTHDETSIFTRKLPEHSNPIQTVSPDHLRVLGELTSQIQKQTQAVRAASQDIENRLDLEMEASQRQLRLLQECSQRIVELKESRTRGRAERIAKIQADLGQRMDKILVAMSAEFKPEIGEMERRWFDELERLRARIRGGGSQRGRSLAGHVQLLQEQLEAVKPSVEMQRLPDESERAIDKGYGNKQLRPLEIALSARSNEIRRLLQKMELLSGKVEAAAVDEEVED